MRLDGAGGLGAEEPEGAAHFVFEVGDEVFVEDPEGRDRGVFEALFPVLVDLDGVVGEFEDAVEVVVLGGGAAVDRLSVVEPGMRQLGLEMGDGLGGRNRGVAGR